MARRSQKTDGLSQLLFVISRPLAAVTHGRVLLMQMEEGERMQISMGKSLRTAQEATSTGILGKGWNSLHETFKLFWKRRLLALIAFLTICAVLNGYYYFRSLYTASTVVSLDYQEASKGLTPSETRFNISEIQSVEVLERLIEYAGLQGEVTADDLSKCIRVNATHNRSVSGKVNFISTSYVIEFTNKINIQRRSASTMLSLLCKAYREFFVEHYGINHSILSFDINDLRLNDEYLTVVDLLEIKCNQLGKYVQLRKRENKNYQDPETGITFSALEQRVQNFHTYDLTRLRSYIVESGIANNKPDLNAMLDYKIRMDHLLYDKFMAAYEEDNKGIKLYDVAMSSIVMIPTEDSSLKYYMSRTKTGMDNMALHADGQLYAAAEKLKTIDYNTYLIDKLKANSPSDAQRKKADAMILQMKSSLETLASDIRKTDKYYTSYKARNYLSFRDNYLRFTDRIEPVNSIFGAALLLFLVFTMIFLRQFIQKKR